MLTLCKDWYYNNTDKQKICWKYVEQLVEGDKIFTSSGIWDEITSIQVTTGTIVVYNLTVFL